MSKKYGEVALEAARACRKWAADPKVAWNLAAKNGFPRSESAQAKSCPRSAFLGLCAEGLIRDVPKGDYTRSEDNRRYAVQAVSLLRQGSGSVSSAAALWKKVIGTKPKAPNGQMSVVLALWTNGLIVGGP